MRGPATARWQPQERREENGEANGRQNRSAASVSFPSSQRSLFEHHLFGKWTPLCRMMPKWISGNGIAAKSGASIRGWSACKKRKFVSPNFRQTKCFATRSVRSALEGFLEHL